MVLGTPCIFILLQVIHNLASINYVLVSLTICKNVGCLQGLGNLVGSFFSCMPITASLSRSLIQQTVGGHTQLASLISCGILVSVLLWIGPFFQPLPRVIILLMFCIFL